MAEASIPVELTNPGQVFACLGFLEVADVLLGDACGGFDWRNYSAPRFRLSARDEDDPIKSVLRFLDNAKVASFAPKHKFDSYKNNSKYTAAHEKNAKKIKLNKAKFDTFPFTDKGLKPNVLPVILSDDKGNSIEINHWGDSSGRDNVKFWAGQKCGACLVRDELELIRNKSAASSDEPFSLYAEQSSSFRFDWRRDYSSLDAGFSLNNHDDMVMRGYPIVELLAVIGLTNARPVPTPKNKLKYRYGVVGLADNQMHEPIFLRAGLGMEKPLFLGMPFRLFSMHLKSPNQGERCIIETVEEKPQS